MSKKITLLALAAISAAMFVMPTAASAGEWKIDPASGKFPQSFTLANIGNTTITTDGASLKVTCTSVTGNGKYENATTGWITIMLHGCTENLFGSSCSSSGQPSWTIHILIVFLHNVILDPGIRGTLLTSESGNFTTFTCGGGLVNVVLGGNGIVDELTNPTACGATQKTATVKLTSPTTGTQKWTQVTTTGTKFDMTTSENGGAARTASLDSELTATFGENQTFTC